MSNDRLSLAARSRKLGAAEGEGIVRCDACPVLCRIRPGRAGACHRYANQGGHLVRVDPVLLLERTVSGGGDVVGFAGAGVARSEAVQQDRDKRVTAGGAGVRYLLARKHGLHMGIDVAVGPDKPIVYVVFGNAWMRP